MMDYSEMVSAIVNLNFLQKMRQKKPLKLLCKWWIPFVVGLMTISLRNSIAEKQIHTRGF